MAEINLSQDEAEALMAMEKCAVDEKDWLFPVPGGRIAIPLPPSTSARTSCWM